MSSTASAPPIAFSGLVETIARTTIVRLPPAASLRLPSRGQVAVGATINGAPIDTVLEPDGRKGHWLRLAAEIAAVGAEVAVELVVRPDWPEPDVPADLRAALASAPDEVQQLWSDITPMARWEWVRWVNATANPSTRGRRVEVTVSKLDAGKRRPCCFDLAACTDPALSRSGKLREPT